MVARYINVSASTGVIRSVTFSALVEPRNGVFSLKFVLSITSVVPSHRPR